VVILGVAVLALADAERTAKKADNLARENRSRISEINTLRSDNIKALRKTDVKLCLKFSRPLYTTLKTSIKNTPRLTYYRNHPRERKIVLRNLRQALRSFIPAKCRQLPSSKAKTKP
jgi:hypothetical protein